MYKVVFVNSTELNKQMKDLPIGILSLATILKNRNYDVDIVDFDYIYSKKIIDKYDDYNMNVEKMANYILGLKPDVVGFYTICNSYHTTVTLAKTLKEKKSDLKIMFGGPQASLTAKESMEAFSWIDVIGIGEGENTIENSK
jgi:radical SAM superfamily enzyme YgiQ (UPF0313 family)